MKNIALTLGLTAILAGCGKGTDNSGTTGTSQSGSGRSVSTTSERRDIRTDTNIVLTPRPVTDDTATRSRGEQTVDPNKAPDNTAQNKRDQGGGTLTPEDQGSSEADRLITQAIRKSIVIEAGKDEHSVAARNIKIITRNGEVTFRGVVKSDAEKSDLESRAKQVAGVTKVNNELEVKP